VKLIAIKCPECNATVRAGPDAREVKCEYCGTQSQVQRRAGLLRRPVPVPAPKAGQPALPVATQKRGPWWAWLLLAMIPAGMLAPIVLGIVFCNLERCEKQARAERLWWDGGGAIVHDVNGDGTLDIVGLVYQVRSPNNRKMLAAFNGATGERLWLGADLGHEASSRHPLVLCGQTLVRGNGGAGLMGISVKDGTIRWRIRLNEIVERICAGDDPSTVNALTADKKLHPVAVADGSIRSPRTLERSSDCKPIVDANPDRDRPDRLICEWSNDCRYWLVRNKIDGLASDLTLIRPSAKVNIALGRKSPGTHVPMIASYRWPEEKLPPEGMERVRAAKTEQRRRELLVELVKRRIDDKDLRPKLLWRATVPGVDPLSVSHSTLEEDQVDLNDQVVVVAYELKKSWVHRLTAFSVEDGRRLWDVALPGEGSLGAVVVTPTHAVVCRVRALQVYSLKTGKPAFLMGEEREKD
jgi:hypothetical protein